MISVLGINTQDPYITTLQICLPAVYCLLHRRLAALHSPNRVSQQQQHQQSHPVSQGPKTITQLLSTLPPYQRLWHLAPAGRAAAAFLAAAGPWAAEVTQATQVGAGLRCTCSTAGLQDWLVLLAPWCVPHSTSHMCVESLASARSSRQSAVARSARVWWHWDTAIAERPCDIHTQERICWC